ncbi:hypothetical protein FPV67DRAFT_1672771 [Lyophyllum atratum]|nr:hypothetical protein FPV67DRAFT_1672771 [Lyophyllum atratum]
MDPQRVKADSDLILESATLGDATVADGLTACNGEELAVTQLLGGTSQHGLVSGLHQSPTRFPSEQVNSHSAKQSIHRSGVPVVKPLFTTPESAEQEVLDSLSHLSVTDPTTPPQVSDLDTGRTTSPPSPFPNSAVTLLNSKGKYYVVSVGRQTGVFTDWNYVKGLVTGVRAGAQLTFKRKADADAEYQRRQEAGMLKVVRPDPEADLKKYGPVESAMMHLDKGCTTPPPPPFLNSAVTSLSSKGKYYVVSVGRRTGVFRDWNYVKGLVTGISAGAQVSYNIEADAKAVYKGLKEAGVLKVERPDPEADLERYGPVESAIM